jgi:hypothetical protein
MIASHPRVGYIDEPFNAINHPECPAEDLWHYVTAEDAEAFGAYLRPLLAFRHPWWKEVRERPRPRRLAGATLRALAAFRRRWNGSRPLLKDPPALFSAEWLADTFGADVVVLIRHPVAFASSLKRLGWLFPFATLLGQPQLMRDYLEPFRPALERVARTSVDVIEHAILAWRVFHHVIWQYQARHPDWVFLRHEDLSLRPVEEFRRLFARLGLDFTPRVRQTVEAYSSEGNASEAPNGVIHELKRNSRASLGNWAHRLLPEEVARVREGTGEIARFFYPQDDWCAAPESPRRAV